MSPKSLTLLTITVVATAGVICGIALSMQDQGNKTSCRTTGRNHVVTIKDNVLVPVRTAGAQCDTLTIINKDPLTREIGFGEHDHHVAYDGVSEKLLRQNQSMTITLVKTGAYHFHDHFHEEVAGTFTVR